MENLFGTLLMLSMLGFALGLIQPKIFGKVLEERATRKNTSLYFGGATILFFILFGIVAEPVQEEVATEQVEEKVEVVDNPVLEPEPVAEPVVIGFETLREWKPDQDPDAIGLEILVDPGHATQEALVSLARDIAGDRQRVIVKIYQDKRAWDEEQTGEYTDASRTGYLAMYIKNSTGRGMFNGVDEIRWFQMEGQLEHLDGTVTPMN